MKLSVIMFSVACIFLSAWGCKPEQSWTGCKILHDACICSRGCKSEYIFRSRRVCLSELRKQEANVCNHDTCLRGTCIQTAQSPGYSCKCEGTGYFGTRCEKVCPTVQLRGFILPHECLEF